MLCLIKYFAKSHNVTSFKVIGNDILKSLVFDCNYWYVFILYRFWDTHCQIMAWHWNLGYVWFKVIKIALFYRPYIHMTSYWLAVVNITQSCRVLKLSDTSSSSSRMRVINYNWSATKQHLHPQSVAEISHHSVLSGNRIRQCETSSGSRHKDTDQCL